MTHRGLLHHLIVTVTDLSRSSKFYGGVLANLGYELAGSSERFQDWKRWDCETPHEISIVQAKAEMSGLQHVKGAVGHHHHLAFCALDRRDVDQFYTKVLVPLAAEGSCSIEDPPGECPEYGEGYYATFFQDPDGLKYEFVVNPNHLRQRSARQPTQECSGGH
jgi:catechol 2,3-dioxygenase-like lactoylglutathione lyase family enzyme